MRHIIERLTCLICIFLAVSGCSSITGAPKPVIDLDTVATQYTDDLNDWAQHPPGTCGEIKDATNKVITLIDLRYAEFVDDITVESKTKATVTDITLTGLGLAGTAVGGAGTKTILHALSAGIAATNTSIDKNFFYEQTLPALVSKMNADRKAQQLLIIKRLQGCKNSGDYSWFETVHDLTDYYAAGTLLGSIASISKDAGAQQVSSEKDIEKFLTLQPSANSPDKQWLDEYLKKSGANRDNVLKCWKKVGTKRPNAFEYASDLFDEPFASDIPAVRQCLEK